MHSYISKRMVETIPIPVHNIKTSVPSWSHLKWRIISLKQPSHKTGGNVWTALEKQLYYLQYSTVRLFEIRNKLSVNLLWNCNGPLHCTVWWIILLRMVSIHFKYIEIQEWAKKTFVKNSFWNESLKKSNMLYNISLRSYSWRML